MRLRMPLTAALVLLLGGSARADDGPNHRVYQPRPTQLGTSGGNVNDGRMGPFRSGVRCVLSSAPDCREYAVRAAVGFIKCIKKGNHNHFGLSDPFPVMADGSFSITVPAGNGWNPRRQMLLLNVVDAACPENARTGIGLLGTVSVGSGNVQVQKLAPPRPNPFGLETTIFCALDAPGRAELRIYDVTGRMVRQLMRGQLGSGPHQFVWDGRDDFGGLLRSGMYFYKLTVDGKVTGSEKAVFLGHH